MRRLLFKEIYNLRELGGFPITLMKSTNYHQFLRSEALLSLTSDEILFFKKYPLTTIIDLRNDVEIERHPNLLASNKDFQYIHIPFLQSTRMNDDKQQMSTQLMQRTLDDIYLEIIADKHQVKKVFDIFANAPGCVLYHCSAGKDRTGVLTALLLLLVGVSTLDIIADYEISFTLLSPRTQKLKEQLPEMKMHIMDSKREVMRDFLAYFLNTYQSAEKYLLSIGVSAENLEKIRKKLLD